MTHTEYLIMLGRRQLRSRLYHEQNRTANRHALKRIREGAGDTPISTLYHEMEAIRCKWISDADVDTHAAKLAYERDPA